MKNEFTALEAWQMAKEDPSLMFIDAYGDTWSWDGSKTNLPFCFEDERSVSAYHSGDEPFMLMEYAKLSTDWTIASPDLSNFPDEPEKYEWEYFTVLKPGWANISVPDIGQLKSTRTVYRFRPKPEPKTPETVDTSLPMIHACRNALERYRKEFPYDENSPREVQRAIHEGAEYLCNLLQELETIRRRAEKYIEPIPEGTEND